MYLDELQLDGKMKLKSIGERINLFDNLETTTVETFNIMFPECPLFLEADLLVTIGEYTGADRRSITVGTATFNHKMFKDIYYGIDRDTFYEPDKDEPLDEIMGHAV